MAGSRRIAPAISMALALLASAALAIALPFALSGIDADKPGPTEQLVRDLVTAPGAGISSGVIDRDSVQILDRHGDAVFFALHTTSGRLIIGAVGPGGVSRASLEADHRTDTGALLEIGSALDDNGPWFDLRVQEAPSSHTIASHELRVFSTYEEFRASMGTSAP